MPACARCGNKGLFIKADETGICLACRKKEYLDSFLTENNFTVDKQIENGYLSFIVDDKNKQWAISTDPENSVRAYRLFSYSDLLNFEVFEDGDTIIKGNAGKAIVGGLLFGGIGALAGAAAKKKVKNVCTSLQVRIMVNSLNDNVIVIPLLYSETKKDGFIYKSHLAIAQMLASTFTYIQHNAA